LNSKNQGSTKSNTDKGTDTICQLIFLSVVEQTKTIAQTTIFFGLCCQLGEFEENNPK